MTQERNLDNIVGMLTLDVMGTIVFISPGKDDPELIDLGEGRKIHRQTFGLLEEIRSEDILVALISGMGSKSYNKMKDKIPHDYAAIEHGGIVLKGGVRDHEWYVRLQNGIAAVNFYKALVHDVLPLHAEDRLTSFRIIPDPNEGLTTSTIARILQGIEPQLAETLSEEDRGVANISIPPFEYQIPVLHGIQMFVHVPHPPDFGCIEVLPSESGKEKSIEFIAARHGLGWGKTGAFGDDRNDLGMLRAANYRMTFAHAKEEVRRTVSEGLSAYSYMTGYPSHQGAIDALKHFRDDVIPMLKSSQ